MWQQDDAGVAGAERPRRVDELARPQRKRLPSRDPAVGDPALADQRKDQVFESLAEERHDGDREQQRRERPHHLDELLDREIDRPGEVAGDRAEDDAHDAGDDHHHDRDHQRDAGAVEQARKNVAPDRIGAEHVRPEQPVGRPQRVREILAVRIVGRDPRAPEAPTTIRISTMMPPTMTFGVSHGRMAARSRRRRLERGAPTTSASRVALLCQSGSSDRSRRTGCRSRN